MFVKRWICGLALGRLAQPLAMALLDRLGAHDAAVERAFGTQLAHAASATKTHFSRRAMNG